MSLLKAVEEMDMESTLWELTDKITAWSLIESAERALEMVEDTDDSDDYPPYIQEDIDYNKRYLSALSVVLDHWTVEDEIPEDIRERLVSYSSGK
jgi:hypothetical protein